MNRASLSPLILAAALLLPACQPSGPAAAPHAVEEPALSGLPTPTAIPTPRAGGLFVDAQQDLGSISPLVYGSNYGPWIAVPAEMLGEAAAAATTIFRFPGGEWGDQNDLKSYQIDAFMAFLERMGGAQGYITARLRGGSAEQAAELVRYTNLEKGYQVRYWSIGNEPTLFAGSHGSGIDYDTEQFNREWREFALAMKAVDPEITLIGPELHQWSHISAVQPKDSSGRDWMVEFLKANGDLVDVVSFHRYPFPISAGQNASIADLRQNTQEWDENIRVLRGLIHEITGRDLPVAVTEVNSHYSKAIGGEGTPDSHYNAIWWADVLGRLIREGTWMVNHWLITSTGGQGGWGLVGRGELRPSYHVYQLYQQFGDELVQASSDDPDVSIYAARRSDGALTLMIINLAASEIAVPLSIEGTAAGPAERWLLDLDHKAESTGPFDLSAGTILLPPQSVSLIVSGAP
jgi:hypothetical protein